MAEAGAEPATPAKEQSTPSKQSELALPPPPKEVDLDIEDNIPEEGEALEDGHDEPGNMPPSAAAEVEASLKRERSKSPSSDRSPQNDVAKDESPPRRRRDSQSSERALKRQRVERWRESGEAGEISEAESPRAGAEPGEASDDSEPRRASRPVKRRPSVSGSQRTRSRSAASSASSDLNSLEAELLGRPVRRQSSGSSAPKTKADNPAPTQSALQSLGPIKKKRKPTDSAYRYVLQDECVYEVLLTRRCSRRW